MLRLHTNIYNLIRIGYFTVLLHSLYLLFQYPLFEPKALGAVNSGLRLNTKVSLANLVYYYYITSRKDNWVKEIYLDLQKPSKIYLLILEKVPFCNVEENQEVWVVDRYGNKIVKQKLEHLFTITGRIDSKEISNLYESLLRLGLINKVAGMISVNSYVFCLYLDGEKKFYFRSIKAFEESYQKIRTELDKLNYAICDLRFHGKAFVKLRK